MQCPNCNIMIDDNVQICPYCHAKVDKDIIRCPQCWAKHKKGTEICTSCGCNISQTIKENMEIANYKKPTIREKISAISIKKKISVLVALVIIAGVIIAGTITSNNIKKEELRTLSYELIELSDDAIDKISVIAEYYENDVYSKDWITYLEAAQSLRELHTDEIEEIKKTREPINHKKNQIVAVGNQEAAELANKVYFCYTSCYGYVIGENGKYPEYLKKYQKLVEEYTKVKTQLKELVK